jgi:thiamine transport system substrate-binding protein
MCRKALKTIGVILLLGLTVSAFSSLRVYTYESLSWIEEEMIPNFELQTGIDVTVVKLGDAGNIVSRLLLEQKKPQADVVIGIDQALSVKVLSENLLEPSFPPNARNIRTKEFIFDPSGCLYPFDYSALAIIYDPAIIAHPPVTFYDLCSFPKSLIMQDPRSSSTGKAFFLWTIAVFGERWEEFWKALKPSILTVTSGWSEAFSKFEIGEASMMVSYATDGAYSYHYYQSEKYKAFIPSEGAYLQIEAAGIVRGTKNREEAEILIDFLLSEEFQKKIPLNQWMFPVIEIPMPEAYRYAVIPERFVGLDNFEIEKQLDTWLEEWEEIMY